MLSRGVGYSYLGPLRCPTRPLLLLVRRPGLEPGSAGLKARCSIAIKLATQKLAGKVGLEPTYDTLTVCSPTEWCTFQVVWVSGFEPLTTRVQSAHSGQAELHPEKK
jgi:hypothetical protein